MKNLIKIALLLILFNKTKVIIVINSNKVYLDF